MKKIHVLVKPRSSNNEVIPQPDGSFIIRVSAPPQQGHANEQVIHLLSDHLSVPKSCLTIKHGLTHRKKIILVDV